MNTQELHELMNGEIDGANTAENSRRLHEYLQKHPHARRRYEELCEAVAALESVEMRDPSPDLRRAILAAVQDRETTAPATTGAEGGLLRRWGAVLKARPGYGYAFAAGLALGIVLLAGVGPRLTGPGEQDNGQLYGTALPGTESAVPAERAFALAAAGATGTVRAWFDDGRIVVRVELDTDGPVQVVLATDPGLVCDSFRVLEPGSHDLATRAGATRLTHEGRGAYEITLGGAGERPSSVIVTIHKDGTLLGEEVLAPR